MVEKIEKFSLPRNDWYDSEGRIFKDVLIENFNAVEAKLLEMTKLDTLNIEPPDISSINYPNVDWNSNDNQIMNLQSFLDLTGLIGYPIEFTFSDTYTVNLSFWNKAYKYVTLKNVDINASSAKPYIYLNYVNNTVSASESTITPANCRMIACYDDGKIIGINSKDYLPINALFYLARMKNEMYDYTFTSGSRDNHSPSQSIAKNGRAIGTGDTNKKTRNGDNPVTFRDVGRTSE